ncbi:hypothetical protein [Nocardioides sp.]|uniref:hypothetical protein n=1 Tax=Nocardioides sp. TaxID=35761 RepID=UPI00260EE933|nr:hypothetical protein [Nocardioides sp.]
MPCRTAVAAEWTRAKGERTVAIVGCVGSAGASTLALSAALAAPGPVRVLECCSATASGLASAATAELGVDPSGWSQARREHVLLERASEVLAALDDVPVPTPANSGTLTFLDVGWEAGQLHTAASWLTHSVAEADLLVLVTPATTPGMRRLGVALGLLTDPASPHLDERVVVAVRGPRRRRWDRGVEHAAGPHLQRVLASGALVQIPECRGIAVTGLDSRPVPPALVTAAGQLLGALRCTTPNP